MRKTLLAMVLVFAAFAPTLRDVEFGRTLENLNVATALEARRDGHWFVPTLEGLPRTKKPPLTAWVTAAAISPGTVRGCSSRDPAVRAVAFRWLAWEARWPALVQACLTLLAVYYFGRAVGGEEFGGNAALLGGASYLFLRYAQVSLTDVPLMLWVTVAHAAFAAAVFRGQRWGGFVGAGVAVGLAFLAKGPVAFALTLVPWVVWAVAFNRKSQTANRKSAWLPIAAGVVACVAVAVPWYLAVLLRDPQGQWHTWFKEVTGSDAPDRSEPVLQYLLLLLTFMPALLFAVVGAWVGARGDGAARRRVMLASCCVVVSLIILSSRKDKKDRYILPLVGPVAVLAAAGYDAYLRTRPAEARRDVGGWAYWGALGAVPVGLAVAGAVGVKALRTVEGGHWFSPAVAGAAVVAAVVILAAAVRSHIARRRDGAVWTLLLMLLTMHLVTVGYCRSSGGRSRMRGVAERVWAEYPDAELFTTLPFGERASVDFSIYLNRTTGWITPAEMAAAEPGERAKVVLVREREREREALALPAGWREVMAVPREDGGAWRVVGMGGRK